MSLLVSVLTPKYLVHVSDAPDGALRTLVLRYANAKGLLTLVGPADRVPWVQATVSRAFAEPEELAKHLARQADVDLAKEDASMLYAGWGYASDGREINYRYLVSSFEAGDDPGFGIVGETMVPTPARPGGHGTRPQTSYSVQISTTEELSVAARRKIEELPRTVKKGSAMDVALAAAAIVRQGGEVPVLIAHLGPDGALEAAVLDGQRIQPVAALAATGTSALRQAD